MTEPDLFLFLDPAGDDSCLALSTHDDCVLVSAYFAQNLTAIQIWKVSPNLVGDSMQLMKSIRVKDCPESAWCRFSGGTSGSRQFDIKELYLIHCEAMDGVEWHDPSEPPSGFSDLLAMIQADDAKWAGPVDRVLQNLGPPRDLTGETKC